MEPYVIWFVAALALLVLELASTTFYSIFLAAGAFAAGVLAFAVPTSPVWIQAVVAIAVALLGVVLVRPFVSRRLRRHGEGPLTPGVHGGFVGQRVLPLDEIGDELHPGHVRLAGETWLAFAEDHQTIATGTPVIVTAVRGTTLVVRPASGPVTPET
jgi:membrane protein implicated in regulation of membrane protease activity